MDVKNSDSGGRLRALHHRAGAFVIPNPWDVGSARILAALGFEALATTSAGMAFALGLVDGSVTPAQTLEHCRGIVAATPLPVSADLEKGFGDAPEQVGACVLAAAATGLAGCSIEDHTGDATHPIYDFDLAVERIAAAVEAGRSLPRDFVLTARCENFLWGRCDLEATIRRLQAFSAAGADVLYAPGLPDLDSNPVCRGRQAGERGDGFARPEIHRRRTGHRGCQAHQRRRGLCAQRLWRVRAGGILIHQ